MELQGIATDNDANYLTHRLQFNAEHSLVSVSRRENRRWQIFFPNTLEKESNNAVYSLQVI